MSESFRRVLNNLYMFEDTCNVYVLKKGEEAVLIDFGSGHVLEHLSEIGVQKVSAVLHTHHHRDQAQGDGLAVKAGIPIHVPQNERHLFDQVEIYWTTKQLYDMYNVRNTYFSLTRSVPVSGVLEDYAAFSWKGFDLHVLPSPGHTAGSVSLLVEVEGSTVAFIGDLIHSPGKVQTVFDMQYTYGAKDGIEMTVLSLNLLEDRNPDLLCPSHGMVMEDVPAALAATKKHLRSFYRFWSGGQLLADEVDFTPVASRLLHASQTCSSFYVILSKNGKTALLVDYGSPSPALMQPFAAHFEAGERIRFIRHSLDRLRNQYGIQKIQAVIPSHYHDDHINGIPYLQEHLGTEVWAYENMKEILENPAGELIGCLIPDPLRVSRTFSDTESFSWEGCRFTVHFSPGHCDYHMSMFTEMDGKRIAFSGDNVWPPDFLPSLIYRNHVHRTSHQLTAELYAEYRPQVLCSGHGLFTNIHPDDYSMFLDNSRRLSQHFDTLLPEGSGVLGLEPSWMQIYPYQIAGKPGEETRVEVRIKNPVPRKSTLEFRWVMPEGWSVQPEPETVVLDVEKRAARVFSLKIPRGCEPRFPKQAIALDVVLDGKPLGQVTEAVVEFRRYGPAGAAEAREGFQ